MTRFNFGSIVVVSGNLIGVVVKCWYTQSDTRYDIYVRSFDVIVLYSESEVRMYIYDKELTDEGRITELQSEIVKLEEEL